MTVCNCLLFKYKRTKTIPIIDKGTKSNLKCIAAKRIAEVNKPVKKPFLIAIF